MEQWGVNGEIKEDYVQEMCVVDILNKSMSFLHISLMNMVALVTATYLNININKLNSCTGL